MEAIELLWGVAVLALIWALTEGEPEPIEIPVEDD